MVEKVFQAGSKEVNDKNVVQSLLAEVVYIRDAGYVGRPGQLTILACTLLTSILTAAY